MFIATYLSFYLLKYYFTAAQRLALCPFRGTGGRDWAPSRRSRGTRQHHFDVINLKPRNLPENAQTPSTPALDLPSKSCGASVAPMLFGDRVHVADPALRGCV